MPRPRTIPGVADVDLPWEKLRRQGAEACRDHELLAVVLERGYGDRNVLEQAEAILRQALNSTDASKPAEIATINFAYGNLMLELQQYDTAIRYFQTALDADRSLGFYKGMADDLAAIGTAHLRSGDKGRAANFFKRSIQIYALIENKSKVAQTLKAFEEAAQAAHMDTRVTKHFVNKWSKGKAFQGPCR